MKHYHVIQACVKYQAFEFLMPITLNLKNYELLRQFVQQFGENRNPPQLKVLHIKHPLFFIDFPAYGFPTFKITFYKNTLLEDVEHYLTLVNNYLDQLQ